MTNAAIDQIDLEDFVEGLYIIQFLNAEKIMNTQKVVIVD